MVLREASDQSQTMCVQFMTSLPQIVLPYHRNQGGCADMLWPPGRWYLHPSTLDFAVELCEKVPHKRGPPLRFCPAGRSCHELGEP